MGELFAVLTSCCFGGSNVSMRRGMQRSPTPDNGIFMVNLTNVVLFVIVALFLGGYGRLLPLTVAAFFLFVLAGVLTTFAGRYFHYAAIRLIGPSRATAIRVSSPVVTGALAFMFLGERLSMAQYLGAASVLAGVALLAREASKRECLEVSAFWEGEQGNASGPTKARRSRYLGSLFAIASAAAFGSGHFVRKVALFSVPSPWWGMLIGSVVGWLCVLLLGVLRGEIGPYFRRNLNLHHVPYFFVLAGLLNGFGQMFSFLSIYFLAVSLASVAFAVEPLVTAVISRLALGQEEPMGWQMVFACLVTVAGLVLALI